MSTRRSELVSAFDHMLEAGRSRFNALDRNLGRRPDGPVGSRATDPEPTTPSTAFTTSPAASPNGARSVPPGQKRMQARFGDRWRHDIIERRIEGNEAIVLGKLTLDGQVVRTQFGRATIGGGASSKVASAAGVTFSLGSTAGSALDREDQAFRLAADDALEKSARLFPSDAS